MQNPLFNEYFVLHSIFIYNFIIKKLFYNIFFLFSFIIYSEKNGKTYYLYNQ